MYFHALVLCTSLMAPPATAPVLPAPSTAPAAPVARTPLQERLDALLDQRALRKSDIGLVVMRLDSDSVLYENNADTLLVPASTAKLLTAVAALHVMTPDYQFATEVYAKAPQKNVVQGDMVVKGYGDPYVTPERLWHLANRIYFAGVHEVRGDLIIDDSYFSGPRMPPGGEPEDTSSAYMAPAGAMSVSFNTVRVNVTPSATPGTEALVGVEPMSQYAAVRGTIKTVSRGRTNLGVDVVSAGERNAVKVTGQIAQTDGTRSYWRRIDNPPLFAGETLRVMLEQLGVHITGSVRVGVLPEGLPQLASMASPRLAELVNHLNKFSNNFMASQLALALGAFKYGAPATWDKAQRAIAEFLQEQLAIAPDAYTLGNPSGLHNVNRVTARQLVRVLQFASKQPNTWPEFWSSLAVAGGSGTLQNRMVDSDATYRIRAKTGTLSTASALAGYAMTKSGHLLAFALMVNNFGGELDDVLRAIDQIGNALAALELAPSEAATVAETSH